VSDRTPDVPAELVDRARRGEQSALKAIAELVYPSVRRWALVHTGDPPDADDLTQDVLVQMLQKLDSFRADGRFTTWLYAVTRNAAADRLRRIRMGDSLAAHPRAYLALVPEPDGDPAGAAERAGLRSLLDVLFQELPWRQREVFDLVELQGFDAAHVAELLDIEPVTVRAHLFKARRRLRASILETRPELVEDFL
jgi:RNA polymerase sigma-70 factor (ECF subfamily)